tara:strand:- start:327 stop:500 length:174 start_codon:yes stop_codon:yes gene_type:complete
MKFILKRIDGKEDLHTIKKFNSYEEAYDFLVKLYGQTCCSDTDFEEEFFYNITEENS